jgi:predicted nucleic acid-binding protein
MPGKTIFLDTNGWLALLNTRELGHVHAVATWLELGHARPPVVLTDWIIAETGNSLARTTSRRTFPQAVGRLLANPSVRIVQVDSLLRARALKLYAERSDKTWGLVDCASFIIMSDLGISDAFTTDRHFEQAGFNCLLPASAV